MHFGKTRTQKIKIKKKHVKSQQNRQIKFAQNELKREADRQMTSPSSHKMS